MRQKIIFYTNLRDKVLATLCIIYIFCIILGGVYDVNSLLYYAVSIGVLFTVHELFTYLNRGYINVDYVMLFNILSIVCFGVLLVSYQRDNNYFVITGLSISSVGMAIKLFKLPPRLASNVIIIPLSVFLIYFMILIFYGIDSNYAFMFGGSGSRNAVSVLLIPLITVYLSLSWKETPNGSIFIFSVLVFVVCSWAVGRSGIYSSGMILMYIIFRRGHIASIIFVTIFIFLVVIFSDISYYYHKIGNFSAPTRLGYIYDYIKNIGFYTIFVSYSDLRGNVNGLNNISNLHNSILNFHSVSGFASVIIMSFVLLLFFKSLFLQKGRSLAFLFMILLFRYSTDTMALIGGGDWVFYFLIIKLYNSLKERRIRSNQYEHEIVK
jgi:hypothetical protein